MSTTTEDTPVEPVQIPESDPTPTSATSPLQRIVTTEERTKKLQHDMIHAVHDRNAQHVESSQTLASIKADAALALRKADICITDVRSLRLTVDRNQVDMKGEIAKVHNRQLAEAQWTRAALGDIYEALGGQARELGMRAKADSMHDEKLARTDEKMAEHDKALATRRVIAAGVGGGVLFAFGVLYEKMKAIFGGLGK